MKRKKKKLIEEFEEADVFEGRLFQFKYREFYKIQLMWTTRGRWISLLNEFSSTVKDYTTLPKTPSALIKASIEFLREKRKNEKIKTKTDRRIQGVVR